MSSRSTTANGVKARPMIAAKQRGPGPGRYALPSTFGHGSTDKTRKGVPAYSFGLRTNEPKRLNTPGPHYVDPKMSRYGTSKGGTFKIAGRPKSMKAFNAPGPGSYGNVSPTKGAPSYSMGARTPLPKKDDTPAPSSYDVAHARVSTKQSPKSYSMGGRLKTGGFADGANKAPAPGTYSLNLTTKKKAPAFSMGGRTFMPDPGTKTPGPGTHSPEKADTKRKQPAYSMGVRHSDYTTPLIIDCPE